MAPEKRSVDPKGGIGPRLRIPGLTEYNNSIHELQLMQGVETKTNVWFFESVMRLPNVSFAKSSSVRDWFFIFQKIICHLYLNQGMQSSIRYFWNFVKEMLNSAVTHHSEQYRSKEGRTIYSNQCLKLLCSLQGFTTEICFFRNL